MANETLLDAARTEAAAFLGASAGIWPELNKRVADELAPLLADIVRQQFLHHLGQPQPNELLVLVRKFAAQACDWAEATAVQYPGWYKGPSDIFESLRCHAERLPEHYPAQLQLDTEARQRYIPLADAARVALTTLEGLQRNPLILDSELAYPIDKLRKALGEGGHA